MGRGEGFKDLMWDMEWEHASVGRMTRFLSRHILFKPHLHLPLFRHRKLKYPKVSHEGSSLIK